MSSFVNSLHYNISAPHNTLKRTLQAVNKYKSIMKPEPRIFYAAWYSVIDTQDA